MDENQARQIATILSGDPWHVGGGIWIVIFTNKNDGTCVAMSDECIIEYPNEEALWDQDDPIAQISIH